jgi:hypothetical protein
MEIKIIFINSSVQLEKKKFHNVFTYLNFSIDSKLSKTTSIERVFKKEASVFREWKEDTEATLKKTLSLDLNEWKVSRFIKD